MADVTIKEIKVVVGHAAAVLLAHKQHFTDLDQEIGDGDMGITMAKIANVFLDLDALVEETSDVGKFLIATGIAANRAASSTMGTLIATALMRAGKEVQGKEALSEAEVAQILVAAVQGMQDRGKAKLGDKTIIDALHPAAAAFQEIVDGGGDLSDAGKAAASAAAQGRDAVTPLRSKIGRASWVGERTEGKVDAGCEMAAIVLEAVV